MYLKGMASFGPVPCHDEKTKGIPGVNVIKLFSPSISNRRDRLDRLSQIHIIFASMTTIYPRRECIKVGSGFI
jgi:hypothetical protein